MMRQKEILTQPKSGDKKKGRKREPKKEPISPYLRKIEEFLRLRAAGYPEKLEKDFEEEAKRLLSEEKIDEAKLQRCRQFFQRYIENLRKQYEITEQFLEDFLKYLQHIPDHDLPIDLAKIKRAVATEDQRMEAAERLTDFLPRPIFWKRWQAHRDAIKRELGPDFENEIRNRKLNNLFIALDKIGGYSFRELCKREFRPLLSAMNNLVTEDILGEKWWNRAKFVPIEEGEETKSEVSVVPWPFEKEGTVEQMMEELERAVEARITYRQLVESSNLSRREAELLEAMLSVGGNIAQASKKLGIKPSTGRIIVQRIKRKMQSLA
jgi:hypothetical protein